MQTSLKRMNPSTLPDAGTMGYSQIVIANPGTLAFVSGQVAQTADGAAVPDGLAAQTRQVIANLGEALRAIGAGVHDIVQMRIYVTDLDDEAMSDAMPVVMAFLDGAAPSLTGIGVAALAGPDLRIEIEMIIQIPT